jgi:glutamate-5-semialdehyde dehydrogenase
MTIHVPTPQLLPELMRDMGVRARAASKAVREAPARQRSQALLAMAGHIRAQSAAILAANASDLERGATDGLSPAMMDRLALTPDRLEGIAQGLESVANQEDLLGEVMKDWHQPNGLHFQRVRIPIG